MSPGTPPPALAFQDVGVSLGGKPILSQVSFQLEAGEMLAVVGPNGAGKTTLLRAALGLLRSSTGSIHLRGRIVGRLPPLERARQIAWLPQSEALSENITVEEFVALGRYPHLGSFRPEGAGDVRAVDRAISEANLTSFRSRGVLGLSGGERQRVLLARCLAQEAPILLLDEPTNHLDMAYQLQVMQDLDRFRHGGPGRAVLISLHDLNLASRFADRILWLKEGRVEALGPPVETMTSDRIYRVYGVDAEIHRSAGRAYVYPPRQRVPEARTPASGPRVHVICGGGSGGEILRRLNDSGFRVTAGALPLLDSDQETCEALHIPAIVEAPFTALSDLVRAEHRRWMEQSEVLVLAPLVVGTGNLANLTDLLPLAGSRPLLLVGGSLTADRDFVSGQAEQGYQELVKMGAREVSLGELIPAVQDALRAPRRAVPDRT